MFLDSFISFLAPGLIAMSILTQSFSHSSSSFMIGKIQGNIVDVLYAPLSSSEVTLAVSLAAATRSIMIAAISIIIFKFLIFLVNSKLSNSSHLHISIVIYSRFFRNYRFSKIASFKV